MSKSLFMSSHAMLMTKRKIFLTKRHSEFEFKVRDPPTLSEFPMGHQTQTWRCVTVQIHVIVLSDQDKGLKNVHILSYRSPSAVQRHKQDGSGGAQ